MQVINCLFRVIKKVFLLFMIILFANDDINILETHFLKKLRELKQNKNC